MEAPPADDDGTGAEPGSADLPELPTDADGWRALIATLPPRELHRLISKDKIAVARLFAGFRPGTDTLRRAVVVQRIVDTVLKDAKFAAAVAALVPPPASASPMDTDDPEIAVEARQSESPMPPDSPPLSARHKYAAALDKPGEIAPEDPRLREKLKEQRTALRQKDSRINALEAALESALRERETARAAAASGQAAQRLAEAEVEKQRRRLGRDTLRESAAARKEAEKPVARRAPMTLVAPVAGEARLVEEGLYRLLHRAQYATVAETCRAALLSAEHGFETGARERGRIHALLAQALHGEGNHADGEAQDRSAALCLLDAGEVAGAAEALGRILTHAVVFRPASLTPLFRRLSALAEKLDRLDKVRDILAHVRISSAEANRRLLAALSGGDPAGKPNAILRALTVASAKPISADEAIALPLSDGIGTTVTARGIVAAIHAGDVPIITRVRAGLRTLLAGTAHERATADALLEAVSTLFPLAVLPLTRRANHPIVADASNVARHNPDPLSLSRVPRVGNLLELRDFLLRSGFFPVVLIADANLRYHVDERDPYLTLLKAGIVRETHSGTSADEVLLAEARHLSAPVVTNDRLAEWGDAATGIDRLGFAFDAKGVSLTRY